MGKKIIICINFRVGIRDNKTMPILEKLHGNTFKLDTKNSLACYNIIKIENKQDYAFRKRVNTH